MIRIPLVIESGETDGVWKDIRKALGEHGVDLGSLEANCFCGVETPNGTFEPTEITFEVADPDPNDTTVQDDANIKSLVADPVAVAAGQVVPLSLATYSVLYAFMRVVVDVAPAADRTVYLLMRRVVT